MKNKKGFTLIEMAVVLLIIGILAAAVLMNINQGPGARDTRRQMDLAKTASYLSTYYSKFGYYPTSSSWSDLEQTLIAARVTNQLPRDPSGGRPYDYYYCTDYPGSDAPSASEVNHFVLRAVFEQPTSTAPRVWENAITNVPTDWRCYSGTSGADISNLCNQAQRYYCVAQ